MKRTIPLIRGLKAMTEMNIDLTQAYASNYLNVPVYEEYLTEEELIKATFTSYCDRYNFVHYSGTGYYGYLRLNDGTVFDTSRDYVYLQLNDHDAHLMEGETKILFIDDDTFDQDGHIFDPDFTASCDDVFVHGGKMDFQNPHQKAQSISRKIRIPRRDRYQGGIQVEEKLRF